MEIFRGEKRLLAVDLANVLAVGDSLTGSPTVAVVVKRGRAATALVTDSPAAPSISGTEVRFWVDVPAATARANYLALVTCPTANGEVAKETAPLLVE